MPDRLVSRHASQLPPLLPDDPLSVLLSSTICQSRTVGILCRADDSVYPVRAIIDPRARYSAIAEALASRLNLQCLLAPPSMAPGTYAIVPFRDAIETCGIPDTVLNVRVTELCREDVIYLGRNALERAARLRAG